MIKRIHFQVYKTKQDKYTCPSCGKKASFKRYVYADTGEPIHPTVGACDRKDKCGYHYHWSDYFKDNPEDRMRRVLERDIPVKLPDPPSTIDPVLYDRCLTLYGENTLIRYLSKLLPADTPFAHFMTTLRSYKIGTSSHFDWLAHGKATVWPQIDRDGRIRTAKIMQYDRHGKRVKKPRNCVQWLHSVIGGEGYNLEQCLFGAHLLSEDCGREVWIVEAEKTALICALLLPERLWLATGGLYNLRPQVFRDLVGRDVVLLPDAGDAFEDWVEKSHLLKWLCHSLRVDTTMQDALATGECKVGDDIADLLLKNITQKL